MGASMNYHRKGTVHNILFSPILKNIFRKKELFIKQITKYERDLLEKNDYLKGIKKVYISSIRQKSRAKRYYTLDWLADKAKELKKVDNLVEQIK